MIFLSLDPTVAVSTWLIISILLKPFRNYKQTLGPYSRHPKPTSGPTVLFLPKTVAEDLMVTGEKRRDSKKMKVERKSGFQLHQMLGFLSAIWNLNSGRNCLSWSSLKTFDHFWMEMHLNILSESSIRSISSCKLKSLRQWPGTYLVFAWNSLFSFCAFVRPFHFFPPLSAVSLDRVHMGSHW